MSNHKVDEAMREKMLNLYEEGNSVRQIAKKLSLAPATVSVHLRKIGTDTARIETVAATSARLALINKRKILLAEKLMEDAYVMRERVWDEYDLPISTEAGVSWETLSEPLLKEQLDGIRSVESLVKTISNLTASIADPGVHNAQNVLKTLFDGVAQLINDATPGEDNGFSPEDRDHDYDINTDPRENPNDTNG